MKLHNKPEAPKPGKRKSILTQTQESTLDTLQKASEIRAKIAVKVDQIAREAIRQGIPLAAIAESLGVSRQAVHQKYALTTATRKPPPHSTLF